MAVGEEKIVRCEWDGIDPGVEEVEDQWTWSVENERRLFEKSQCVGEGSGRGNANGAAASKQVGCSSARLGGPVTRCGVFYLVSAERYEVSRPLTRPLQVVRGFR